jgi:RimJ/RimL family protein N-acetyltransferase
LGDADWLDGEFSAGDLLMVSVLLRLRPSGVLDEFPELADYVARGEARPAYGRAFAAQWAFNNPGIRADHVRDVSGARRRVLRRAEPDDIAVFFEQQADPAAAAVAAFPSRERVAHDEPWARILGDSSCVARAIVLLDGQIVGNIGSFDIEGERHVVYWIGREHWGQGHATRALTELVTEFPERPLYAHVAEHNTASMRVLAKCGFVVVGEAQERGDPVKEIVLRLS